MSAAVDPDDDYFGDERPILEDDLAAFVRIEDRHRSLTVVREEGDVDTYAETQRWLDKIRADSGTVQPCKRMAEAVERWADGSRDGQLRGALSVVRADEQGHRGLAAALDQLLSVRAKDPRDFEKLMKNAREVVYATPSPPERIGCWCDGVPLDLDEARAAVIADYAVIQLAKHVANTRAGKLTRRAEEAPEKDQATESVRTRMRALAGLGAHAAAGLDLDAAGEQVLAAALAAPREFAKAGGAAFRAAIEVGKSQGLAAPLLAMDRDDPRATGRGVLPPAPEMAAEVAEAAARSGGRVGGGSGGGDGEATVSTLEHDVANNTYRMKVDDLARSARDAEQCAEATATLGTPSRAIDGYEPAPMHVLPTVLREVCETVAESVQVRPELPLMSALPGLSFATGGGIEISINGHHREPLSTWTLPTAAPSERKTGVLNAVVRDPLKQAVKWFWEPREAEQRRLEALIESCTKRIEQLNKFLGTLKASVEEREKALDDIEELTKERRSYLNAHVHKPLYGISDVTVEALEELMAERGGAVGSFTDEAALLSTITGRYSTNGGISLGSMNSSWSGSEFSVYRRSSSRCVQEPFLVLALLVQPEPAKRFLSALRGQADGFLSRWLFAEVAPFGRRPADAPPLDESAVTAWTKVLHALLERGWGRQQLDTLHLTAEAWALRKAAHGQVEDLRAAAGREDGVYVEWLGKALNGHITRIAALFALIEDPETRTVGSDAMARAIELFGWLRGQAERVMRVTGGQVLTVGEEHEVLTWLIRTRAKNREKEQSPMPVVQARDLVSALRKYRGSPTGKADADAVLALLGEAGWLIRGEDARRADASARWLVREDFEAAFEAAFGGGEA